MIDDSATQSSSANGVAGETPGAELRGGAEIDGPAGAV
jgi:hypothetical protein